MWSNSMNIHVNRYCSVSHTGLIRNGSLPKLRNHPSKPISIIELLVQIVSQIANTITMVGKKKLVSLACLIFQTSALILTLRFSRNVTPDDESYIPSTVVVLSESIKIVICLLVIALTYHRPLYALEEVIEDHVELLKLAIPAALYTLQNNLQFIALSNLDAATFQVTYQLKILTTAIFSVTFLKRRITNRKWLALVVLTFGVSLVQLSKSKHSDGDNNPLYVQTIGTPIEVNARSPLVGVIAVICMCLSSGFAGVYFEKILKGSHISLWSRNIQLAVPSTILGTIGMFYVDGSRVLEKGFFHGYSTSTWLVVIQQALLGLVISMVIKYADNIIKSFAAAISIILSSVIAFMFLDDLTLTGSFLTGTLLVLMATVAYSVESRSPLVRSQIAV